MEHVGACTCLPLGDHPRADGHVITRDWQRLPCCRDLASLLGSLPLQMRVFPSLQVVEESLLSQVQRQCKAAGFPRSYRGTVAQSVLEQLSPLLASWAGSLPRFLLLRFLRPALRRVHNAGFVFLQIDRNPQRLMAVCRDAWFKMHCGVFLTPRYSVTYTLFGHLFSSFLVQQGLGPADH